jgi:hypothetical protein
MRNSVAFGIGRLRTKLLMESVENICDAISSIEWFSDVGENFCEQTLDLQISDFNKAINFWAAPNFNAARSIAWESFRGQVLKYESLRQRWIFEFERVNNLVRSSINRSERALSFIDCSGQTVDDFCRDLPFVGAVGELLIESQFPQYKFFTSQIDYYSRGRWVCGWSGELMLHHFEYPQGRFYIF